MNGLQRASLGAAAGSLALLLGALAFQYLGGLAPCHLCILQRWPHLAALFVAGLILLVPARVLALFGCAAVLVSAAIGFYHTGVERAWWAGPDSCTAPGAGSLNASDLLDQLLETPPVLCDQVAWQMFGLSMASWNVLASLFLAWLWYRAWSVSD